MNHSVAMLEEIVVKNMFSTRMFSCSCFFVQLYNMSSNVRWVLCVWLTYWYVPSYLGNNIVKKADAYARQQCCEEHVLYTHDRGVSQLDSIPSNVQWVLCVWLTYWYVPSSLENNIVKTAENYARGKCCEEHVLYTHVLLRLFFTAIQDVVERTMGSLRVVDLLIRTVVSWKQHCKTSWRLC